MKITPPDGWEVVKEPDGAPLELRKLDGVWIRRVLHEGDPYALDTRFGPAVFVSKGEGETSVIAYIKSLSGKLYGELVCVHEYVDPSEYRLVNGYHIHTFDPSPRTTHLATLPEVVLRELERAREIHPDEHADIGEGMLPLMEEVGEVAKAIQEDEGIDRIREELVHVMVVAARLYTEGVG